MAAISTLADRLAARSRSERRVDGAGRVLVAAYAILAVAATGRSAYQIATQFETAPLAYALSALAALVYALATVALLRTGRAWRRIAWLAIGVEFTGVIAVGLLSALAPSLFPHDTVWSGFGRGYGMVPAVLPLLGMAWLESLSRRDQQGRAAASPTPPETTR